MKLFLIFMMCLLCVSCKFKPYDAPGSEMTYNGVYFANANSYGDKEIKKNFYGFMRRREVPSDK